MKALVYHGPGHKQLEDRPKPEIQSAGDGCCGLRPSLVLLLSIQQSGAPVHERPVGFQQIVGKAERVGAIAVEHAKGWNETRSYDCPSNCGADHGIAIVEQGIGAFGLAVPAKLLAEQAWPVTLVARMSSTITTPRSSMGSVTLGNSGRSTTS